MMMMGKEHGVIKVHYPRGLSTPIWLEFNIISVVMVAMVTNTIGTGPMSEEWGGDWVLELRKRGRSWGTWGVSEFRNQLHHWVPFFSVLFWCFEWGHFWGRQIHLVYVASHKCVDLSLGLGMCIIHGTFK